LFCLIFDKNSFRIIARFFCKSWGKSMLARCWDARSDCARSNNKPR